MAGVVLRPGEGESLFGGRIVLKAFFDELCVTESSFADARPGAEPHVHYRHADSFYVLEGELAVLVHDEEHAVGAGGCVCAPPGVVHGFRSTMRTRFLNVHTPDAGFADNLRDRDRGGPGGFDSVDVPAGTGLAPTEAVLLASGEGERLESSTRVATIKVGRDELSLIEFELGPGYQGPDLHTHEDHVDAFYVLAGEAEFMFEGETLTAGPGTFVAAPLGVEHTFSGGAGPSRLLNIHAPSGGFHEWLRGLR
jgi:mannose-6-phosphate isomerase-like protein (cupin superfamily)